MWIYVAQMFQKLRASLLGVLFACLRSNFIFLIGLCGRPRFWLVIICVVTCSADRMWLAFVYCVKLVIGSITAVISFSLLSLYRGGGLGLL